MNPFSEEFMNSPQGQAALAASAALYAEFMICGEFTAASEPEMRDELISLHMQPVYEKIVSQPNHGCGCDDECNCDEYENDYCIDPIEIAPGLSREAAEKLVDVSVYVWLCNYKGEGEGFAPKTLCKGLRTFHAKYDYS